LEYSKFGMGSDRPLFQTGGRVTVPEQPI